MIYKGSGRRDEDELLDGYPQETLNEEEEESEETEESFGVEGEEEYE